MLTCLSVKEGNRAVFQEGEDLVEKRHLKIAPYLGEEKYFICISLGGSTVNNGMEVTYGQV